MPGAADTGLQEPEHELAVVQQVQKGSISSAGTKAQLTVKLPGVSSADDVQVRCTISSVSVAVPGRYRLHLFLPFCIKDEAESVKFSGKKQPPTLTVTLAVESNISPPVAAVAPPAAAPPPASQSAAARAFSQSSTGSSQGVQQRQGRRQQQQHQSAAAANSSSSSIPASNCDDKEFDIHRILAAGGPMEGTDRSTWLLPYAMAADWIDRSGGNAALHSMLWTLSPYSPPPEDEPDDLLPLTLRGAVLALLTALLQLFMGLTANAYALGYCFAQSFIYAFVSASTAAPHLKTAYVKYTCALNSDNSFAPTLLKLLQSWQAYHWLWQLTKLLRVNVLLSWSWRNVLWPVLLGQFWRPRVVITVPFFVLSVCVHGRFATEPLAEGAWFCFVSDYHNTQLLILLLLRGGWQTVVTLLLAASFMLPRLPRHLLWPWCFSWRGALLLAPCFIAPAWPLWWQRWAAGVGLALYVWYRGMQLWQIRQNRRQNEALFGTAASVRSAWHRALSSGCRV